MELKKTGDITRVGDDKKPHSVLDRKAKNAPGDTMTYTAIMANYFSTGECARIGFNFEKRRTRRRAGNMFIYATEWLKRYCCGCCTKKRSIKSQINYAHQIKPKK